MSEAKRPGGLPAPKEKRPVRPEQENLDEEFEPQRDKPGAAGKREGEKNQVRPGPASEIGPG